MLEIGWVIAPLKYDLIEENEDDQRLCLKMKVKAQKFYVNITKKNTINSGF